MPGTSDSWVGFVDDDLARPPGDERETELPFAERAAVMWAALAEDEYSLPDANRAGASSCNGDLSYGPIIELAESTDVDEALTSIAGEAQAGTLTESP